jgi:hypothetical protein
MLKTLRLHQTAVKSRPWLSVPATTSAAVALVLLALGGCARDVHLAGVEIPHVEVKPVTHYGLSLDEHATPEQVVFAAMRAIREDFEAGFGAEGKAKREAALNIQFDLCAADTITATNPTRLVRDEYIYNVVYRWTPTVSHYVGDLPTTWEEAQSRLVRRPISGSKDARVKAEQTEVAMLVNDPDGEPDAAVVLVAWLAKDKGLWRITHFGFDQRRSVTRGGVQEASRLPDGS